MLLKLSNYFFLYTNNFTEMFKGPKLFCLPTFVSIYLTFHKYSDNLSAVIMQHLIRNQLPKRWLMLHSGIQ